MDEGIDLKPPAKKICLICSGKPYPEYDEMESLINKLEKAVEEEKKHLDVKTMKNLYHGQAFIVFNKQNDIIRIIDHY